MKKLSKAATREKEENDNENWVNHHIRVIRIWRGREKEGSREKKKELLEKKRKGGEN